MKTDSELNRLITEHVIKPAPRMTSGQINADGSGMSVHYTRSVFNYIYDPVAHETLWRFLTAEGWHVTIDTFARSAKARLTHGGDCRKAVVRNDEKGRALVLATLAAYGVEVEG